MILARLLVVALLLVAAWPASARAAYDFNGTTAKIDFGDVTFLDGLTTISGHVWINPDTLAASEFNTVVAKLGASGFRLLVDGGAIVNQSAVVTYDDGNIGSVLTNSAGGSVTTAAGWISVGFELQLTATGLKTRVGGIPEPSAQSHVAMLIPRAALSCS